MKNRIFTIPFVILLATGLIFVGCNKDKEDDFPKNLGTIKLEIYKNDQLVTSYGYDDQNRIISISTTKNSDRGEMIEFYSYNDEGDLSSIMYKAGKEILTFSLRREGNVIHCDPYDMTIYLITCYFSPEESEVLISKIIKTDADEGKPFYIEYSYAGNRGIAMTRETNSWNEDSFFAYWCLSFDEQKAPLSGCNTPKWVLALLFDPYEYIGYNNNALEIVYSDGPSPTNAHFRPFVRFEYTYNSNGYAQSRIDFRWDEEMYEWVENGVTWRYEYK